MTWQSTRVTTPVYPMAFSDDKLRFVWVTDSHVSTMSGTSSLALLKAVEDCNTWRPNALLHTGDIGDNLLVQVQRSFYILQNCQRPVVYVIGNHDEYEAVKLSANTLEIAKENVFNRYPFYTSTTISSGDGTLTALCLLLDCNFYDDDPDDPPPGDDAERTPGDRIGYNSSEPSGGYWRRFTATQLAFVEAALVADVTSDIVLVFVHQPPAGVTCTDYVALADLLQADGRPAAGFCGHVHQHGSTFTLTSTDTLATFTFYKCPALLESGGWCRLVLSLTGGVVTVDSAVMQNYTNPGAWTLSAPFATP